MNCRGRTLLTNMGSLCAQHIMVVGVLVCIVGDYVRVGLCNTPQNARRVGGTR